MYKIIGADGKEYGPVTSEQVRQWITEGRANAQTKVQPEAHDRISTGQRSGVCQAFATQPHMHRFRYRHPPFTVASEQVRGRLRADRDACLDFVANGSCVVALVGSSFSGCPGMDPELNGS